MKEEEEVKYFMCCDVCGGYWAKAKVIDGVIDPNLFKMQKEGKEVWASYGMQFKFENKEGNEEKHRICLPCLWDKLSEGKS